MSFRQAYIFDKCICPKHYKVYEASTCLRGEYMSMRQAIINDASYIYETSTCLKTPKSGNIKGGSITVLLTSRLTGLESAV
jgi:hypothetical protein